MAVGLGVAKTVLAVSRAGGIASDCPCEWPRSEATRGKQYSRKAKEITAEGAEVHRGKNKKGKYEASNRYKTPPVLSIDRFLFLKGS